MKIFLQHLDDESKKTFEISLINNEASNWNNVIKFVLKSSQALENVQKYV